jgi:uncharacterized protein YukE
MGYKLKVNTPSLEEQRETLKSGFSSIHNGLKNIETALTGLDSKGLEGKAADSYEELVSIVKADVIAPTDRYNDLVLVNLNAAAAVFSDL